MWCPCFPRRANRSLFSWAARIRAGVVIALGAGVPLAAMGPAVNSLTPSPATANAALTSVTLGFTQALDGARARSASAYELLHLGANRVPGGGDDTAVSVTPAYNDGALAVTLATAAPLVEGRYRVRAKSDATNGLRNLAAEYLDQNQDGTPDDYVGYFDVDLTPPAVSGAAAGTCVRFEDGYDLVALPAAALHGRAAYTVELWFQTTRRAGQSLLGAMQSGNTAALQFWLSDGTLSVDTASGSPSVALPRVYDGRWHHLAVAYSDAADRMEVIYDGAVVASVAYTGAPPSVAAGAFFLGQEQDSPGGGFDSGQAFQGRMAEVRIWDTARSAADVAAMMYRQARGDEPGLAAAWRLDDAADTVPDVTGHGFDATLGDWQGGDLPQWVPAPDLLAERRTLHVTFADAGGMAPATVQTTANYAVVRSGGDGSFGDGNETDVSSSLQAVTYLPGTTAAVLRFAAPLPEDLYRLMIAGAGVTDLAGNPLLGGSDYQSDPLPAPVGPTTVTVALDPGSDTGASNSDRLTGDATPALAVTVNEHGTAAVYVDGVLVPGWGQAIGAAGTHLLTAPAPLAPGYHRVSVVFTPWVGEAAAAAVSMVVEAGGPRAAAVVQYTPSPCFSRVVQFDRPVSVAGFLPGGVAIAAAGGGPIGTASAVTPLLPGLKFNPGTGTWYLPVCRPEGVTWFEAEAEACRLGGALVSIASSAEMGFVLGLVADASFRRHVPGGTSIGPWIGLRREPDQQAPWYRWVWPDGAPMGYTYWGSNQPDNAGGGQYVVHLGGDSGYWYDAAPETLAPGFVVEFPAAPAYASSWRIAFDGLPGGAEYTLRFGPDLTDAAGNPMDQDGDGVPGETAEDLFTETFVVPPPAAGLQVVSALPAGADAGAPFRLIEVVFNRPVDASSVGASDAALTPAAGGAPIAPGLISQVDAFRWRFDFGAGATGSAYALAIGPEITSGAVPMDQDGDGTPAEAVEDVFRARLQKADLTLAGGDTSLDGLHLVFRGGTHVLDGPHSFAGIALLEGALLTHSACTAGAVYGLELNVAGTVFIDAASAIDTTGKGYLPGRTGGNVPQDPSQNAGGGSHGGLGRPGTSVGAIPAAYDDFTDPREPGGGGSVPGGGLIRLQAGMLVVDGAVRADGRSAVSSTSAGGGAGGGILLQVGTLAGSGWVTADGGSGDGGYYGYYGGSGGGGRVAVYYDTAAGFDPERQVRALSRNYPLGAGSAGTVYLCPSVGAAQLRVDSQGTPVGQYTPLLPNAGGDVAADSLVIAGPGVVAEVGPGVGIVADSVAIVNGATLTHAACTADTTCSLDMTVTGTLLVGTGSAIDVTGRGYLPGRTGGNVPQDPAQGPAGGSHGGLGRTGTGGGNTPAAYGDFTDPDQPGGGGSQTAGGGLVRITAGTAVIDGTVRANGADASGDMANSAGAGGGVRIDAGTLAGAGLISADGGAGTGGYYGYYGGSGGGGRVALYYGALDGFDVENRVTAHSRSGGTGPGSLGTVYLCRTGQTPQLRVDSHGTPAGLWTPLLAGPDGTVPVGDLTVAGAGVVAAPLANAPIRAESIAVLRGANLTHPMPSATATFVLEACVAGTLFVDADSRIDVSGRGCPGTTTLGVRTVGAAKGRAGGSHGGAGFGDSSNSLYGQAENPRYPGSGGAPATSSGGSGGGLVRLHAGSAVIDGAILANGVNGSYYWAMTGGSGGGILLNVGDWSGTGVIEARGGDGNWGDYGSNGGSGGGGRIAVHVGGSQGAFVPRLSAAGGTGGSGRGGDGTVVLNTAPSFFWTEPRHGVFGDTAPLRWELLAAPPGTTVALYAARPGAPEVLLAEGLPPVGSWVWDTGALPAGVCRVRAVYSTRGLRASGEASREILICHHARLHGGALAANERWDAGELHLVADDILIPSGATLTLAAGTLVKVAEGRSLRVLPGGALVCEGTPESPAVFTSLRDDARGGDDNGDGAATRPAAGDWAGVIVETGAAGPAAGSVLLLYGTREQAGQLAAGVAWEAENLHRVRDDVTVPAGVTLTIAAGAVVRFDRTRAIVVSGALQAQGTLGAPVLMTSLHDAEPDAPGMAGGPYAGLLPAAGDWLGVYVEPGGSGVLDRVHLRYGGGRQTGYDRTAMLRSRRSSLVVRNCRIENAQYDGVGQGSADSTSRFELINTIVTRCDVGFYGADNSAGVCQVLGTTFYGNRLGVRLDWGSSGAPRIIRNSIIAASTETGISVWGGANVFEWNDVWGSGTANYAGGLADQTGRNGNLSADPRFRDPGRGDFGLSSRSPCIDAGNGLHATAEDFAGLPRNDYPRVADTGVPMPGTAVVPDMGALEYSEHVNTNIDLVVTGVTGPAAAAAGDEVTVTWQVANRGTERASGWRRDRVGLSTLMGARGQNSLVCGDVAFTGTIEPGQTAAFAARVRVPGGTPGVWNWTVTVNAHDDLPEGINRTNNTGLSAATVTLSLPVMVLNAPEALTGTLAAVGAAAWYAVAVPAGRDALIRVDAGVADARLRLYAAAGFLPTPYDYDWVSPTSAADPRLVLPGGAGPQTVYVLLLAEELPSGPTTFTAGASELAFALDACDLRRGGNAGAVTVRLAGAGFSGGMAVSLRNDARGEIPAQAVSVLNSGEAFAVLPLSGAAPGVYDVVAGIGGREAALRRAFTVVEGIGWNFFCRVTAPPLVRPGRPFPVLVEFENTGDADCPPILMSVSNDGGFPIWRNRRTPATVLTLAAVAPSGPTPGYLRPGERHTVAVWSASNNVLCHYTIAWRSAFCTEPIDWDGVEAALCPCNRPHWDEVWPAMKAAVGSTDGDYIRAAAAAVAEARTCGAVLLENTDIFQWLLDREMYRLPSAAVTGAVRRQGTLEPVGRLAMTLVRRGETDGYTGTTWYDGSFAFWDVPPGVYDVLLEGVYGAGGLTLEVPPEGVLRDVVLELPAGGALAGSVTDAADGAPVSGAEVEVRDPAGGVGARVLTDAGGRYHVSGLPPGTVHVRVLPVEHAPAEADVTGVTAGATAAWSVAVQPGAVISGVVSAPGGGAVAGAAVLASPGDGSAGRSTRSGADGSYEIRGLAAGTYRLTALADGYGAGVLDGVAVAAGGRAAADLVLTIAGDLSGRVLDAATDTPIAGAEIAVSGAVSGAPILTDAEGQFAVGSLPAGDVALTVTAEGYLPLAQVVTIGGKAGVDLRLDRPWAVEGRVLDGVGPGAGLEVALYHAAGASAATTTSADGAYAFTDLQGGQWRLIVSTPGGEILVNDVFTLTPAEKTAWKEYVLSPGLVTGRVLDAYGAPLAGAEVRMARDGAVVAETYSGGAGAFEFRAMTGGVYDISVTHREFGFARRSGVAVVAGAVTDLGDWSPSGAEVRVLVTDGTTPLAGASVELAWLSGLGGERVMTPADAAGRAAFAGLPDGNYRLSASATNRARVAQDVAVAGADVEITAVLPAEGVVAGTVTAPDGGAAPYAMIWGVDQVDGTTLLALSDADGSYSLGGLPAHPLTLWVTDGVSTPAAVAVTPAPGAVTTVDVALGAAGARLRGRVVNASAVPLGGVRVAVQGLQGIELRSTITGMDGAYVAGPLPDGGFTLQFTAAGLPPVTVPVTVSGADAVLDDVVIADAAGSGGRGGEGAKWSIWDWLHGQQPPRRYVKDTPAWRALHQAVWAAYLASGRDCPEAAAAYDQASRSARSIDTRYDAWCLAYAAMSGMTSAEMNTLAAEIGILTGKISLLVANFTGAMENMTGPAFLAGISPNAPADLVKAYNDMGFAIDFAVDSLTRLVVYLRSGDVSASDAMFEQALSSVQFLVGAIEMFAKVAVDSGVAGNTATTLAGGAVGKALGVVMALRDLFNYWKDLKDKEKNILETIKANERAQEMYHDMVQRHIANLARLQAAVNCDDDDDPPPPPPPPPPPNPPPPPGGFPQGGDGPSAAVGRVISRDPNAKESLGVGTPNWVAGDRAITYIIYFENESDASAPAQTVTITDVLDAVLDLESFEPLQVSFNQTTLDLPPGSRNYLGEGTVDSDPYPVRIRVALDPSTRTATWVLQSFDPATGALPTDPLAGFLPPNDETGRGEGFVSFRIAPRAGLPTGTTVRNVARIVFDENEPILTNQVDPHDPGQGTDPAKEALATIDAEAPVRSQVVARKGGDGSQVMLALSLDDGAGSGVGLFEIFVARNGGALNPWRTTADTLVVYDGTWGTAYDFLVRGHDAVGYAEEVKAVLDASVELPDWAMPFTVTSGAGSYGLWAGVASGATDGYDTALDEEAPAGEGASRPLQFAIEDATRPALDYDVRPAAATVTWRLQLRDPGAGSGLAWDPARIPAGHYLWLVRLADGRAGRPIPESFVDLSRTDHTTLREPGSYQLTLSTSKTVVLGLGEGWNLVSTPVGQDAAQPGTLGSGDSGVRLPLWVYAGGGPGAGYIPARDLAGGDGFWVYAPAAAQVLLTGEPARARVLQAGWNLVGVSEETPFAPAAGMGPRAWEWDERLRVYRSLQPGDALLPGKAYWVWVEEGAAVSWPPAR